jgi:hypothetical protein
LTEKVNGPARATGPGPRAGGLPGTVDGFTGPALTAITFPAEAEAQHSMSGTYLAHVAPSTDHAARR